MAIMIEADQIIYLDNNATTRPDPAVVEEMVLYLEKLWGNPSSGYRFGKQVRAAVDLARQRVATLLGCEPSEVVFTSGGTESNNTAINAAFRIDPKRQHIVTTAVEHNAVVRYCEDVAKSGCDVTFLSVNEEGEIDLAELEAAIRPDTAIVSVMWANNETGVVYPIDEIAEIARRKRVLFHTDAVQAVGKVPLKLAERGISFLSLSAHKFHGPKGIGALYVNRNVRFSPMIFGGSQEDKRRGGTENVASIVGLGKAAELALASRRTRPGAHSQIARPFRIGTIGKSFRPSCQRQMRAIVSGNTSNLSFPRHRRAGAADHVRPKRNLFVHRFGLSDRLAPIIACSARDEVRRRSSARQRSVFARSFQYRGADRKSARAHSADHRKIARACRPLLPLPNECRANVPRTG